MLSPPSIAERIAYGTPVEAEDLEEEIRLRPRPTSVMIGRLLIAVLFLASGVHKLTQPDQVAAMMTGAGIPQADTLVIIAGIAELVGGGAIAFGFLTRVGALGLILYMIPATLIFHGFWNFEGEAQQMQMTQFLKNLAIMGGLFAIMGFGPGRYSLDAQMRKPMQP